MGFLYSDSGDRARVLSGVRRIVVKVGSNVLRAAPAERTQALVDQLARLRDRGIEPILVTSGAIPLGMTLLGRTARPKDLSKLQALSAIGQGALMRHYEDACEKHGMHCAQLLLTAADLRGRERNLRVSECIRALLADGVLPVINENDSVSVAEIKIGDNDTLAAMVATMLGADLTVLMTTVDAFHETAPNASAGDELGRRISVVTALDERLLAMAGATDGNPYSTGGMMTKLHAASICTAGGHSLAIVDGRDFENLARFLDGEDIGTLFCCENSADSKHPMRSWQRFLTFFSEPAGAIVVDEGAAEALCRRNKSLLPGGVLGVRGAFRKGDAVRILNCRGEEIARGVANFSCEELARVCGAKSAQLPELLGHPVDAPEAVHKDFLVLQKGF